MTDIVERLRAVDHMMVEDCFLQSHLFALAADEIERLRKDNAELLILVDMTRDAAMGHQERAEGLREALRGLLADTQHAEHDCGGADCPVALARAALTEAGYG